MCDLSGVRIVVTRAAHQAGELAGALRGFGAEVLLAPMIGIAPPTDPAPLREAASHCDAYDWILFTSANAVAAFAAERRPLSQKACAARFATIGAATREAAEKSGFHVELVPPEYVAESLIEALGRENLSGKRVLIPSAALTRDLVPPALRQAGATVDVVESYRNVVPAGAEVRAAEVFRQPVPQWVTFASSSAAANTVRLVGVGVLEKLKIATIGPITSDTVRKYGLEVAAEAKVHTIDGLVQAICQA